MTLSDITLSQNRQTSKVSLAVVVLVNFIMETHFLSFLSVTTQEMAYS